MSHQKRKSLRPKENLRQDSAAMEISSSRSAFFDASRFRCRCHLGITLHCRCFLTAPFLFTLTVGMVDSAARWLFFLLRQKRECFSTFSSTLYFSFLLGICNQSTQVLDSSFVIHSIYHYSTVFYFLMKFPCSFNYLPWGYIATLLVAWIIKVRNERKLSR